MEKFEICIVGAGVTGLAIAYQLAQSTAVNGPIVLLDAEDGFGRHTSSRNSEVIHAGIYYPPDSLKARLCVRGKHLLYAFCREHAIPHQRIGKYIVSSMRQLEELARIQANASLNGVDDLVWVERDELTRVEPAVEGDAALFSPSTGIVDSHAFMAALLHGAEQDGLTFSPFTRVTGVVEGGGDIEVMCRFDAPRQQESFSLRTERLINCAGLGAQRLAALCEGFDQPPIPPLHLCKGDYFTYSGSSPFKHLIYPMPDPDRGGLGIHGTLDMGGQCRFGPDADYISEIDYAIDPHKAQGFATAIRRYFPALDPARLEPSYAGIRPKLVPRGAPAGDFVIQDGNLAAENQLIHLFGIESPGLTASLAIAEEVIGRFRGGSALASQG